VLDARIEQLYPADLIAEPGCRASFGFDRFLFAIFWWRRRFEGVNQTTRHCSYFLDRSLERGLICLRRFVKTGYFSYELERSTLNLFGSDGWIKVEKRSDVPAHSRDLG
jgi:hypothetical protein